MKTTIFRSLAVLAALTAISAAAFAQGALGTNRSSISGYIFTPDRQPVGRVWVELLTDTNSTIRRIRTDDSGRYFFSGLGNGRYTVRVLPLGTNFEEQSEDIELAGTGLRGRPLTDNQQRDIYLKLRKGSTQPLTNEIVFAQEVPPEAERLYKSAVTDIQSQRLSEGAEELEKALALFPNYFAALVRLGIIRLSEQKFDDAVTLYSNALTVNPRCFDCHYGIAYAQFATKKYQDAIASCERALLERSDSAEANLLLGMAARNTRDLKKAESALVKAAKISDGRNPDVHWQLALLYGRDQDRYADAARELELYLKAAPDAPNKEDVKKVIKQFKDKAKSAG